MQIIVGSVAMKYWGLKNTLPYDVDIWVEKIPEEIPKGFDLMQIPREILELVEVVDGYATIDSLYTIKCSHLAWDIHWEKHKRDTYYLQCIGATIIEPLFEALVKHWTKLNGSKDFLSLNKSKEDFFTDKVEYVYDHDYLHELVAFPNQPVYTKCLKEGEDVFIDREKFDLLSLEDQIRMFREEVTVIARERWLISKGNKPSWSVAYKYALRKTVVSLTKGWATEFMIRNIDKLIKPDYSYFKHLLETVKEGKEIMSKVDLTDIEEFYEASGMEESIQTFVFNLCEDELYCDFGYQWVAECPSYRDRYMADYDERMTAYREDKKVRDAHVDKALEEWGYEHLQQEDGGEGGAEDCYGVFKLKGKTYMAEYQYYSHEGCEYAYILDTVREVKPIEKTITVYQ